MITATEYVALKFIAALGIASPCRYLVFVFCTVVTTQEWGVDGTMGVLTKHGYAAARSMGKYQGRKYATDGLKLDSCSDMFVYCEEARIAEVVACTERSNEPFVWCVVVCWRLAMVWFAVECRELQATYGEVRALLYHTFVFTPSATRLVHVSIMCW